MRAIEPLRAATVATVALTGLALGLGFANKARCTGPDFDAAGRSGPGYETRINADVCYSDIQHLWPLREINEHSFPYVGGSIDDDGMLRGSALEYPVLTGLMIWVAALPADTDAEFLLASALLLACFGLLTAWLLGRLAGWRALVWALGPPLVLYGFHNWDLTVAACTVGAVYAVHGWRPDLPLTHRAMVAAAILGLGFAFKLYAGIFLLPLALVVLTGSDPGRLDWRAAARVLGAGAAVALAVNLPIAIAGFDGWSASFVFQTLREADITTNSIWFWGFRPESDPGTAFQATVDWLSPLLVVASMALALALGWRRWMREGAYPWLGVSAAMLCGVLLFHKVHSPQYVLWLLPFFVLLRVPWTLVGAYLAADLALGIGLFRWYYEINQGAPVELGSSLASHAVAVGVWGRAALLAVLFVVFLRAPPCVDAWRSPNKGVPAPT